MRTLPVIALLLLALRMEAQVVDGMLDKLADKFSQADYAWVLKKAEAMMDNDKTRSDPEPYMWASMCHYELALSEDEQVRNLHKGGVRDALKLAAKSASKDKEGKFTAAQSEYLSELKREGIALALEHVQNDDLRKANHIYKQILTFAPEDDNVRLAKAVTDLKMNNTSEAEKLISEALPRIEANYRDLSFKPDPISSPLLRDAMLYYIDHLELQSQRAMARDAAFVGRIIFPLDEEMRFKAESLK